jgi:hypothetical protein
VKNHPSEELSGRELSGKKKSALTKKYRQLSGEEFYEESSGE